MVRLEGKQIRGAEGRGQATLKKDSKRIGNKIRNEPGWNSFVKELVKESRTERPEELRKFVDRKPKLRTFSFLFQRQYNAEVNVLIEEMIQDSGLEDPKATGAGTPEGRARRTTEVFRDASRPVSRGGILPPKGTQRGWDKQETDLLKDAIRKGLKPQQIYFQYTVEQKVKGQFGRNRPGFDRKYYRVKDKMKKEGQL